MKIQLVSFVVQGKFFHQVVRIYEQGNKALINCVGGAMQQYIGLGLF